jgi:hypothetical protein
METRKGTSTCEYGNELISFLYGELNQDEARRFEQHSKSCSACNSELGAFKEIRESIGAWRENSLGTLWSGFDAAAAVATIPATVVVEPRRPSALAAIREFLALSPLWMKGVLTFASVLFCLLAALFIAQRQETPGIPPANASNSNAHDQEALQAMIERRAQDRFAELKANLSLETSRGLEGAAASPRRKAPRDISNGMNNVAYNPVPKARRPLTKAEREQLAADLRLISKEEAELDLLGDRLNRQE